MPNERYTKELYHGANATQADLLGSVEHLVDDLAKKAEELYPEKSKAPAAFTSLLESRDKTLGSHEELPEDITSQTVKNMTGVGLRTTVKVKKTDGTIVEYELSRVNHRSITAPYGFSEAKKSQMLEQGTALPDGYEEVDPEYFSGRRDAAFGTSWDGKSDFADHAVTKEGDEFYISLVAMLDEADFDTKVRKWWSPLYKEEGEPGYGSVDNVPQDQIDTLKEALKTLKENPIYKQMSESLTAENLRKSPVGITANIEELQESHGNQVGDENSWVYLRVTFEQALSSEPLEESTKSMKDLHDFMEALDAVADAVNPKNEAGKSVTDIIFEEKLNTNFLDETSEHDVATFTKYTKYSRGTALVTAEELEKTVSINKSSYYQTSPKVHTVNAKGEVVEHTADDPTHKKTNMAMNSVTVNASKKAELLGKDIDKAVNILAKCLESIKGAKEYFVKGYADGKQNQRNESGGQKKESEIEIDISTIRAAVTDLIKNDNKPGIFAPLASKISEKLKEHIENEGNGKTLDTEAFEKAYTSERPIAGGKSYSKQAEEFFANARKAKQESGITM